MPLTIAQTSIQQGTYENTGAIREAVKNIDKTTKGIAESAGDISHKAREITVCVTERVTFVQVLIFPTGSRGPRSPGQTQPHPKRRTPG